MFTETQSGDVPTRPINKPAAPPVPDLCAVVALGFVPATMMLFFEADLLGQLIGLLFVAGIGTHCYFLRRAKRSASASALTGAWLFPLIIVLYAGIKIGFYGAPAFLAADLIFAAIWLPAGGFFCGFLCGKLFEAIFYLVASLPQWLRYRLTRSAEPESFNERIDEASTPLESPPICGIPRRFGIRGLLIIVTWASVIMSLLRAWGVAPSVFFVVLTFVGGTMLAQAILFRGREPLAASMWAGAFLLPNAVLVVGFLDNYKEPDFYHRFVGSFAAGCICLVPAGILLGAVAGRVSGMVYAASDSLLLRIFRGLPAIELQPAAEADVDVLQAWIRCPKLCQRWSSGQLTFPLDREHLLERFATAVGDRPARRIFKAVEVGTRKMVGYVEIGQINHLYRRGRLELPLVDPAASERGRLGVALMQKIGEKALLDLRLVDFGLVADSRQSASALCFARAWEQSERGFYSYRTESNGVYMGLRLLER